MERPVVELLLISVLEEPKEGILAFRKEIDGAWMMLLAEEEVPEVVVRSGPDHPVGLQSSAYLLDTSPPYLARGTVQKKTCRVFEVADYPNLLPHWLLAAIRDPKQGDHGRRTIYPYLFPNHVHDLFRGLEHVHDLYLVPSRDRTIFEVVKD